MAEPYNRQTFKDYVFRRLGYPVLQINVSEEQAQDRIDDALDYFRDFHYFGTEKFYYVHTLTQEEIDNKEIQLPPNIASVVGVMDMAIGGSTSNFMSDKYQFLRSEFFGLATSVNYSLIPYYVAMTRIADLEFLLSMTPSVNYDEGSGTVSLVGFNESLFTVGNKIIFETLAYVTPGNNSPKIWNDRWLKRYATALMKRQWAENLKLYSNIPLVGGITLDAQSMFQEAQEELQLLEDQLKNMGLLTSVLDQVG